MSSFKARFISVKSIGYKGSDITLNTLISKYPSNYHNKHTMGSKLNLNKKLNNLTCKFDFNLGFMIMFIYLDDISFEIPISDIKINVSSTKPNDQNDTIHEFNIIRCVTKSDRFDALEFIISTDVLDILNVTYSYMEDIQCEAKVHFNMAISTEEVLEWWKSTYDRISTEDNSISEWNYDEFSSTIARNLWLDPISPTKISDYVDISDTWSIKFTGKNQKKKSVDE